MNPHRINHTPKKPVGFGWALLMIVGVVLAVLALITRCTELI